jgi:hypothetical protein
VTARVPKPAERWSASFERIVAQDLPVAVVLGHLRTLGVVVVVAVVVVAAVVVVVVVVAVVAAAG